MTDQYKSIERMCYGVDEQEGNGNVPYVSKGLHELRGIAREVELEFVLRKQDPETKHVVLFRLYY